MSKAMVKPIHSSGTRRIRKIQRSEDVFIFNFTPGPLQETRLRLRQNQWRFVHCNEIMIGPLAFAARWPGKTRGAIGFSLNFLVTFSFKRKSDREILCLSRVSRGEIMSQLILSSVARLRLSDEAVSPKRHCEKLS